MRDLTAAVVDAIHMAGFVEIEVSAKHVHLTQEDVEVLFGKGAKLEPKRPLSQPGQFLSNQRVTLIGPKRSMERVAVLGPVRSATQVELSKSDCVALGVDAPIRESGDIAGSGSITIQGPCGSLEVKEGVIIAHNHIHVTEEDSIKMGLADRLDFGDGFLFIVFTESELPRFGCFKNIFWRPGFGNGEQMNRMGTTIGFAGGCLNVFGNSL